MDEHRLLCVLAHPDDETLALGGILTKYAAERIGTYVITATRGELGWQGPEADHPGPTALAVLREAELRAAAATLGVREVEVLGYPDGGVAGVQPGEGLACLVTHLRRIRPQVVVTFPPDGLTGHPDHIAISQLTTAAVVAASDQEYGGGTAHRVAKLYHVVASRAALDVYEEHFGDVAMTVDGIRRSTPGWPDWLITTRVAADDQWERVWRAVCCYETQSPEARTLARLPPETHQELWCRQEFYRAFSLVPTGEGVENDLFAGLT